MFALTMRDYGIGILTPDCPGVSAQLQNLCLLIKLSAFSRRTLTRPFIRFSRFAHIAFRLCDLRANGVSVAVRCSNLLINSSSTAWVFPPAGRSSPFGNSRFRP